MQIKLDGRLQKLRERDWLVLSHVAFQLVYWTQNQVVCILATVKITVICAEGLGKGGGEVRRTNFPSMGSRHCQLLHFVETALI